MEERILKNKETEREDNENGIRETPKVGMEEKMSWESRKSRGEGKGVSGEKDNRGVSNSGGHCSVVASFFFYFTPFFFTYLFV